MKTKHRINLKFPLVQNVITFYFFGILCVIFRYLNFYVFFFLSTWEIHFDVVVIRSIEIQNHFLTSHKSNLLVTYFFFPKSVIYHVQPEFYGCMHFVDDGTGQSITIVKSKIAHCK